MSESNYYQTVSQAYSGDWPVKVQKHSNPF